LDSLGRDKKQWGEEGTGKVTVDPDKECENGCPYYNDVFFDSQNDPIHLNIAAFRDRLCPRTFVQLIQQGTKSEPHLCSIDPTANLFIGHRR
jgi:hypothetical protein